MKRKKYKNERNIKMRLYRNDADWRKMVENG